MLPRLAQRVVTRTTMPAVLHATTTTTGSCGSLALRIGVGASPFKSGVTFSRTLVTSPANGEHPRAAAAAAKKKKGKEQAEPKDESAKPGGKTRTLAKEKKSRELTKEELPPPRPLSAFFLFLKKYRTEKGPGKSLEETAAISKSSGEAWRQLSQEEKQPYLDEAASLKERYEEEKAEYVAKTPDVILRRVVKENRFSGISFDDPTKFTTVSPYIRFYRKWYAEEGKGLGLLPVEVSKIGGEKWRALSEEERQVYCDEFRKEEDINIVKRKEARERFKEDEARLGL